MHRILTRHRQFANRLIMLANLHILVSKTLTITLHHLKSFQSTVVEHNSLLQVPKSEIIISQIAEDLEREDGIANLPTFNCRITVEVIFYCKSIVIKQEIGFS